MPKTADASEKMEAKSLGASAATSTAPTAAPAPASDLDSPALTIDREVSWLAFNERVLDQALDQRWPLLERVKFLAI